MTFDVRKYDIKLNLFFSDHHSSLRERALTHLPDIFFKFQYTQTKILILGIFL